MNDTSNPNYIWYTELGNPYVVKALNFLKAGDNATDIVKALHVYNDNIVVFCTNSIWMIFLADPEPTLWRVLRVKSSFGCKSPYGIVDIPNEVLFPAWQGDRLVGFARISGTHIEPTVTLLSTHSNASELASQKIEPSVTAIQEAYVSNISAISFQNKAYISVTSGDAQTTNNRVLIYDFSLSNVSDQNKFTWSILSGWNAAQFAILDQTLYFGGSTGIGQAYRANTTSYNDNGSAINSYFFTKEFGDSHMKDFRYLTLFVEASGSYNMDVYARTDSGTDDGQRFSVDLTNTVSTSVYGTGIYGVAVYSSTPSNKEVLIPLSNLRGKRIQFKFTNQNTVNQKFKVLGMNIVYNEKSIRRI